MLVFFVLSCVATAGLFWAYVTRQRAQQRRDEGVRKIGRRIFPIWVPLQWLMEIRQHVPEDAREQFLREPVPPATEELFGRGWLDLAIVLGLTIAFMCALFSGLLML